MKLKLKLTLVLLVGVVLSYTACKKSGSSPAPTAKTQAVTEQAASGQIATNLAQSLAGAYGGASIYNGVAAPAVASTSNSGHAVNSLGTNSACGFFVDSLLNVTSKSGDSIKSTTTGTLAFHFKCGPNGLSTGYTIFDSLTTAGKAPGYTFTDIVVQDYDVLGLNNANTKISLDGSLKSWVDIDYTKKGTIPFSLHNKFILSGLKIDLTTSPADITDGTATFVSDGSSSAGIFRFTGTIVFLGNHMVKITINGLVFHANLVTGVVTPG